jgi:hypothetical protein
VSAVTVAATLQLGKTLRGATNPNLPTTSHTLRWVILLGVTIGLLALVWLGTWRAKVRRRRRGPPTEAILAPSDGRASRRGRRRDTRRGEPSDEELEPVRWRADASNR